MSRDPKDLNRLQSKLIQGRRLLLLLGLALPVFCAVVLWWGNKNEADVSFGIALSLTALIGLCVLGFVYVLDLLGDLQNHIARTTAVDAVRPTREGERDIAAIRQQISALSEQVQQSNLAHELLHTRIQALLETVEQLSRHAAATADIAQDPRPVPVTASQPSKSDQDQAMLPLTKAEQNDPSPLPQADYIRALNFPQNETDKLGFTALRKAMRDHTTRQLIRAAEDVLTLLSQDGIYMDDLTPKPSSTKDWRLFSQGARGAALSGLATIQEESVLELTQKRMREDLIFRDAAHHFLRIFDKSFMEFERQAREDELAAFAQTRTARAFMVLGSVTGTFE